MGEEEWIEMHEKLKRSLQKCWSGESGTEGGWAWQGSLGHNAKRALSLLVMSKFPPLFEGQHCATVAGRYQSGFAGM